MPALLAKTNYAYSCNLRFCYIGISSFGQQAKMFSERTQVSSQVK